MGPFSTEWFRISSFRGGILLALEQVESPSTAAHSRSRCFLKKKIPSLFIDIYKSKTVKKINFIPNLTGVKILLSSWNCLGWVPLPAALHSAGVGRHGERRAARQRQSVFLHAGARGRAQQQAHNIWQGDVWSLAFSPRGLQMEITAWPLFPIRLQVTGDTIYNLLRLAEVECDANERPLKPHKIRTAEVFHRNKCA